MEELTRKRLSKSSTPMQVIDKKQNNDLFLNGICKDYDNDCKNVKDHFKCWLGGKVIINGEGYECKTSNGLCPFIHNVN